MANTRTAAKRARQAVRRQERNQIVRSATRSQLKSAISALKTNDAKQVRDAYIRAVKALSKAATKGAIPKGRAARKISRLTLLTKRVLPAALTRP